MFPKFQRIKKRSRRRQSPKSDLLNFKIRKTNLNILPNPFFRTTRKHSGSISTQPSLQNGFSCQQSPTPTPLENNCKNQNEQSAGINSEVRKGPNQESPVSASTPMKSLLETRTVKPITLSLQEFRQIEKADRSKSKSILVPSHRRLVSPNLKAVAASSGGLDYTPQLTRSASQKKVSFSSNMICFHYSRPK